MACAEPNDRRERAICILQPIEDEDSEEGTRFRLNPEIANELIELERLQKSKVAVISVAGAFRKGKSFLLNFFVRYLRTLETGGDTSNWIHNASCSNEEDGFHWQAGSRPDTAGILIWSRPFFIRKPGGEEVAVLLMDTQGIFDPQSTQQDNTIIFAFSTLLSSVQIFNVFHQIEETDLQHLRLFVEFAAMAKNSSGRVLQHLWFLVRDWQNPDEHKYGAGGGEEYLDGFLLCDKKKPKENQQLRQGIQKYFERASCCLLPHPGGAVADSKFRGEIERLEPNFVQEVIKFVVQVASPDNLVIKNVNGKELTGLELMSLLVIYFGLFRDGSMPQSKSIYSAMVEAASTSAAQQAKQHFEEQTSDLNKEEVIILVAMSESDFTARLKQAIELALQVFDSRCMEKDSWETQKARKQLNGNLDDHSRSLTKFRQLHQENFSQQTAMEQIEDNYKTQLKELEERHLPDQERDNLVQQMTAEMAALRMQHKSKMAESRENATQLMNSLREDKKFLLQLVLMREQRDLLIPPCSVM